jgi:flagellar biosynthesis/type III secretory pathway chaperone
VTTAAHPIIEALHGQVDCYRRLAKLAALQHEHVQQGRTEQLLEVLGQRQSVMDQLAALERVVAPVKRQWSEFTATLAPGPREEAEGLLAETRRLLEEITAADCNDVLVLQQRKLNLGRQINQAASARLVNRNYAAAAYGKKPPAMDVQQ